MKTRILSIAFLVLTAVSCQQNKEEPAPQIDNTFRLFAVQDNGADSKTVISGEKSVYWDPAEEIKVFKSDGSGFLFKSSNTEPVASAVFSGVLSKDDVEEGEELWAVYPFAEEATFDGEAITTVLPSEQVARAESFGRNMNLSIAKTTSTQLQFYNVGGGIRFTITQEGVNKVVFEGLNGEIISGKVTVGFEEGVPVVKEVTGGSQFITLLPPEGETFQKDKWYYIVAIPGALSGGYKLRFYKAEDYAKKVSETPVTINRGIFGSVDKADESTEYESVVTSFPETEEEWDESENITMSIATASKLIIDVSKELSDNNSPNPIFVATELTKIDGVFKAEPNLEENSVTIVQDNGVYITLFLDLGAIGDEVETKSTNNSSSLTLRTNANSPILPTSKKAILLSPYQNSHYENGKQKGMNKVDIDKVREYLSSTGYTLAPYIDSEVSIEQMTGDNLLQYGVIIYIGHGGFRQPTTDGSSLTTILATGQEIGTISKEFENKYRDKLALAIYDGNPRYYITIPWLEATTNACYSNSIVYIGACNSYRDDDLFNYFWDNGARSYLGFGYYTFYHLENEDQNQAKAVLYSFLEGLSFGASSKNSFTLAPTIIQNEYPYFAAIYNSFSAAKWSGNNVYLTYPKPNNLKNTIKDNTVTFSWNNPPSSGQYKYYVYLNGIAYESQTERGLTLNDLTPGPYNWYVQADLYYRGKLIESFTSDTKEFSISSVYKPFTIQPADIAVRSPGVSGGTGLWGKKYSVVDNFKDTGVFKSWALLREMIVNGTISMTPSRVKSELSKHQPVIFGEHPTKTAAIRYCPESANYVDWDVDYSTVCEFLADDFSSNVRNDWSNGTSHGLLTTGDLYIVIKPVLDLLGTKIGLIGCQEPDEPIDWSIWGEYDPYIETLHYFQNHAEKIFYHSASIFINAPTYETMSPFRRLDNMGVYMEAFGNVWTSDRESSWALGPDGIQEYTLGKGSYYCFYRKWKEPYEANSLDWNNWAMGYADGVIGGFNDGTTHTKGPNGVGSGSSCLPTRSHINDDDLWCETSGLPMADNSETTSPASPVAMGKFYLASLMNYISHPGITVSENKRLIRERTLDQTVYCDDAFYMTGKRVNPGGMIVDYFSSLPSDVSISQENLIPLTTSIFKGSIIVGPGVVNGDGVSVSEENYKSMWGKKLYLSTSVLKQLGFKAGDSINLTEYLCLDNYGSGTGNRDDAFLFIDKKDFCVSLSY